MTVTKRVAAIYMLALAVAVAVHFIIDPLYQSEDIAEFDPTYWRIMDPLMVLGALLALVATFARKRRLTAGSDIREYLEANVSFYAAAILSIIYPWNWFGVEFGFGGDFQMWAFTNPVLVVLLGSAGFQLLREAAARDG